MNKAKKKLTAFRDGMRVKVRAVGEYNVIEIPPTTGTVVRLRMKDGGAWVKLDRRVDVPGAHPFPDEDDGLRGRDVLAYPDDCELA